MSNHLTLLYPTQDDFNYFHERSEPQVFNYVCLHGKQMFLTVANGQYEVVSAGWLPKECQNITNLEKIKTYHCLLRTKQYEIAYYRFYKYVNELVRKSSDEQMELF